VSARELPTPSTSPLTVHARAPRWADAILMHGYTGTPFEVQPLADVFADAGITCVLPVLPGHCSDPAALNRTPHRAWLDHARDVAETLAHPRIAVGSSMGGLLALHLAAERRVDAVVLLAPALRFFPVARVMLELLDTAGVRNKKSLVARALSQHLFLAKEAAGGDIADVVARSQNPTYKTMPLLGIIELLELQRATMRVLPDVTVPVIVFHGDLDHTIDPQSATDICARIRSRKKEHVRLAHTQHLVALDVERDAVCDAALAFVRDALAA
jgi:carboxylesterase